MKIKKTVPKNDKEIVVSGIKILRGISPKSLSRESKKRPEYKDWKLIISSMKKGDLAVLPSRNYWISATYSANKLGVKLELLHYGEELVMLRKN